MKIIQKILALLISAVIALNVPAMGNLYLAAPGLMGEDIFNPLIHSTVVLNDGSKMHITHQAVEDINKFDKTQYHSFTRDITSLCSVENKDGMVILTITLDNYPKTYFKLYLDNNDLKTRIFNRHIASSEFYKKAANMVETVTDILVDMRFFITRGEKA